MKQEGSRCKKPEYTRRIALDRALEQLCTEIVLGHSQHNALIYQPSCMYVGTNTLLERALVTG
jgi:hypothetical protein